MNVKHILKAFIWEQHRERISSRLKSHNKEFGAECDDALGDERLNMERVENSVEKEEILDSRDELDNSSRRSDFESRAPNMANNKATGAASMFVMAWKPGYSMNHVPIAVNSV